jgi:pimeloyl-ACP methyl ester carboxylesterase
LPRITMPDGTQVAYRDRTSPHPRQQILLLHGLAGHVGEWDDLTPRLLADGHRVVSYDARGHGESTRRPENVTRAACVEDAATLIEELSLAPVTLVGQSLGGHTAMLLASARPDLVRSLTLIEAGPAGRDPDLPSVIATWLADWHPEDRAVMVGSIAELATNDYWREWSGIRCPTLLIQGQDGTMRATEPADMLASRPTATHHTLIPGAGHDVHLDQPERLYEAIAAFLDPSGLVKPSDADGRR